MAGNLIYFCPPLYLTQKFSNLFLESAYDPKSAIWEIWFIYPVMSHNDCSLTVLI